MINRDKIKEVVDIYLRSLKTVDYAFYVNEDEGYKFKFVNNFIKNFNLRTKYLSKMIAESIPNRIKVSDDKKVPNNLYYPLARKMFLVFCEEYPKEVKKELLYLVDEKKDIVTRINRFEELFVKLMEERNQKKNRADNHYINLRFTSLILSSCLYKKHYYIKPGQYKIVCEFIDNEFIDPGNKNSGEQYVVYKKYLDEVNKYIRNINDIQKLHNDFIIDLDFKDEEYNWLTQDIMFRVGNEMRKNKGVKKIILKVSQGQSDQRNYTKHSVVNKKLYLGWLENLNENNIQQLNEINNKKEFKDYITNQNVPVVTAEKCWSYKEAGVGSIAIANKGKNEVLAIGKITDNNIYFGENDLPNRQDKGNLNYKKIKWIIDFPIEKNNLFHEIHTIEKITTSQWNKIKNEYFKQYPEREKELVKLFNQLDGNEEGIINEQYKKTRKLIDKKKNIILYGPPGTGKTYNTKRLAIELFK